LISVPLFDGSGSEFGFLVPLPAHAGPRGKGERDAETKEHKEDGKEVRALHGEEDGDVGHGEIAKELHVIVGRDGVRLEAHKHQQRHAHLVESEEECDDAEHVPDAEHVRRDAGRDAQPLRALQEEGIVLDGELVCHAQQRVVRVGIERCLAVVALDKVARPQKVRKQHHEDQVVRSLPH